MRSKKRVVLDLIISEISKGKNPAKIAKENNISKQKLQYYMTLLKKEKKIIKVSYGVWKVTNKRSKNSSKDTHETLKQIRGHAFIWKVKLPRNINWKNRLEFLGVNYQLVGIKSTPRILYNDRKIWLTQTGMVIYEPKSYFGRNSIESKGNAILELDRTIKGVFKLLELDNMKYKFTTSREHFGMINNELARQYNSKGEKLYVQREDGTSWLWIDDSFQIGELENDKMLLNKKVQDWYNDHKKHKFEVTPSFLMEQLSGMLQVQQMHSQNIVKHQKVLDEMLITLKMIQKKL